MKNKTIIKLISIIVIMCACLTLAIKPVNATSDYYKQTQGGAVSNNVEENNYGTGMTGGIVYSNLQVNSDGTISRIEGIEDKVIIETYDASFNLKSTKTIQRELSFFGGFYSGEKYNFLVFGQHNPNEDDTVEVLRVVKYSKTWEKLGTASVKGENTYAIFQAGSCRMTELDGVLFVDTSHTMYASNADGLHHQSNMLVKIDEETMEVTDCRSDVMNISATGYVSHSFNQFILTDGEYIYTIDHGDGFPRGISICKTLPNKIRPESVAIPLEILGDFDSNETGVSIGGAELSTNNCLIAGNSIVQQDVLDFNEVRNIFLTITPKDNVTTDGSTIKWITNYTDGKEHEVRTPHLVKINDNKFLIMWEETVNGLDGSIKMVLVDENGNKLTDIITMGGRLSDCKPIIYNNKVTWYVTVQDSTPIFFSIDVSTTQKFEAYNNQNMIDYDGFKDFDTYSNKGELQLYDYIGNSENVTIPYINYPWIKFDMIAGVFKDLTNIKKVTLPEGITRISKETFSGCTNLTSVNIPSTVKTIEERAFYNTGLTQITIPNTVTTIEASAFRNNKQLTTAKLPDGITTLSEYIFYNCTKLKNVTIPSKVTSIGDLAFAMTGITELNIPSSVQTIGEMAFYYCQDLKGTVIIPKSVTFVGYKAFNFSLGIEKYIFQNPNVKIDEQALDGDITVAINQTIKPIEGIKIASTKNYYPATATISEDGTITTLRQGMGYIEYYDENNILIGSTTLDVVRTELPFTDVSGSDWFYSSVKYVYNRGIILGTSETTFNPRTKLTRGMLVTILHRMEGKPTPTTENKFNDVYKALYYYDAIRWATEKGIVHGYDDGSGNFGPDDNVTRQDLAVILRNYAQYKGKDVNVTTDLSKFSDGNLVSDYAKTAMQWAVGKGVITGNDTPTGRTLTPHANSQRAEAAGMIYNYCTKVKDSK